MNRAAQLNDVTDLDQDRVERAYDRWAPIYDLVFGAVFKKGRSAALPRSTGWAVASSRSVSNRNFAAGIRARMRVFGIDISAAMLKEAQKRVDKLGLKNVEGLEAMDARTSISRTVRSTW